MADIQKTLKDFVETTKERIIKTPPVEWAITGAAALLICLFYNAVTKEKNESALNFSTVLFAAFLTLSSVLVRPKKRENQYAWSVVIMSLVNVLFKASGKLTPLFLAVYPPLINYVRDMAKK